MRCTTTTGGAMNCRYTCPAVTMSRVAIGSKIPGVPHQRRPSVHHWGTAHDQVVNPLDPRRRTNRPHASAAADFCRCSNARPRCKLCACGDCGQWNAWCWSYGFPNGGERWRLPRWPRPAASHYDGCARLSGRPSGSSGWKRARPSGGDRRRAGRVFGARAARAWPAKWGSVRPPCRPLARGLASGQIPARRAADLALHFQQANE